MTSYAPLFQNVAYKAWEPDMIIFNNHEDYAIPSYYMLEMFGNNRGDYVCEYDVVTENDRRIECGHFTAPDGMIVEGKTYSSDIEISDGFRMRFWDRGTVGEDQNHYDWIIENGTSKVIHYNGWSAEIICSEIPCEISDGINHIELTAFEDSFKLMLDDKVIHEHTLGAIPHITAVCTVDMENDMLITKLVNFSENDVDIRIISDRTMQETAEITTLTADSYYAKNTFENKAAVVPYTETISASSDYTASIKARSVNVITHKIAGF